MTEDSGTLIICGTFVRVLPYCFPIGVVAGCYGETIGVVDGRENRCVAGDAGADRAQNTGDARASAWLRDRTAHRADQRRLALGELRDAFPCPAQAGARGLHRFGVGAVG